MITILSTKLKNEVNDNLDNNKIICCQINFLLLAFLWGDHAIPVVSSVVSV